MTTPTNTLPTSEELRIAAGLRAYSGGFGYRERFDLQIQYLFPIVRAGDISISVEWREPGCQAWIFEYHDGPIRNLVSDFWHSAYHETPAAAVADVLGKYWGLR